uniref:Uncharacterized protein LOC111104098 n=1 Tax=Crassostrea virginica TaxID=6565 RepID=A0A8B8AQV8_CRAVI|nr:uncharacterized protein LOC111104098 [Crassostrea virginica]XP_022293553.1 uncharacterized protein LOC111104098 [Crassostrea virginica]XP_022293554.1 uncharacterized protein LOC111104098 [Crassostrea virginica]XP_022293555.1 uncharacterized protein LOC111104098 [Crassostrea virginica]XP_022293556.1 uncharacterized protein LOC111104098 [Crassostrea virginica]XP_022293557.1 uncharacterized protein LOC111104098 [Crassostrea virginica]
MWEDPQTQMNGIVIIVFCLLPAYAKGCYFYNATFILREKELFNETNYHHICLGNVDLNYKGKVTFCGSQRINPKCVCGYDMYEKDIIDLCDKKRETVKKNGSLLHQSIQFCKTYSHNKNGPCQNGGELILTNDLAIDAKCRCKGDFSGDFCDTVTRKIVCTQTTKTSGFQNCSNKFNALTNPVCLLSFESGKMYTCDSRENSSDRIEECKPTPENFVGNASKALCSNIHGLLVVTCIIIFKVFCHCLQHL